jgi:hypothetical protein
MLAAMQIAWMLTAQIDSQKIRKPTQRKTTKGIIIGFQIPAYDTINKLHTHSTHLQDQYTTDEADA